MCDIYQEVCCVRDIAEDVLDSLISVAKYKNTDEIKIDYDLF